MGRGPQGWLLRQEARAAGVHTRHHPGTMCLAALLTCVVPRLGQHGLTARMAMTNPMMVMTLLAPSEVVEHESVTGSLFRALHR